MIFNCKIALLGLVTVVTSHSGNSRFDIHNCNHLQLTDDDQCVETIRYGDDYDCMIRVLSDMQLSVRRWDVENHDDCAWDYLEAIDGENRVRGVNRANKRFCTESPAGYDVYKGQLLHWHTDEPVTKGGWKICATPKFRFRGSCDHLDITDDGNCLETRVYGDNHDCTIETTGNFRVISEKFDVEYHSHCNYDWLKINGVKSCGNNFARGSFVNGNMMRPSSVIEWHTDHSGQERGWRICGVSCFQAHAAYGGPDVVNYAVFTNSVLECQRRCLEHPDCSVFTYNSYNRRCHMKETYQDQNYDANAVFISGPQSCTGVFGNWRRLEDSNQGGSRLLKLAQVLDMNTEKDVKIEKEE